MERMETQKFPMALIGTPGEDLTTPWRKSEWWSEKFNLEKSMKISISNPYGCKVYEFFFQILGYALYIWGFLTFV